LLIIIIIVIVIIIIIIIIYLVKFLINISNIKILCTHCKDDMRYLRGRNVRELISLILFPGKNS